MIVEVRILKVNDDVFRGMDQIASYFDRGVKFGKCSVYCRTNNQHQVTNSGKS